MFRLSTTPIIRCTQNYNYSLRYWSYFCAATWPAPEAVVTVLCAPDDGCGWHPKHVQGTCRIINRLFCVASRWTFPNIYLTSSTLIVLAASQRRCMINTTCCTHSTKLPDDEELIYSKHVEYYYWNKLREKSASCGSLLRKYIMMHGPQNVNIYIYIYIYTYTRGRIKK